MKIHHTIIKGAALAGVILTANDDAIIAHHAESNLAVHKDPSEIEDSDQTALNELARDAWRDVLEIRAYNEDDNNVFTIRFEDGDFVGFGRSSREEVARDPVLEDLIETLKESEDEEVASAGDGDEEGVSVVPDKYKVRYTEAGHPTHCGDWLAETLNSLCRVKNEKGKEVTDIERLETIASANSVEPGRYGKLGVMTNGWQGRFRMTVRNMLAPLIATKGFLFVPDGEGVEGDKEIAAPPEWRAAHTPKPKKVVQKDPGAGKPTAATIAKGGGKKKGKAEVDTQSVNDLRREILEGENANVRETAPHLA